MKKKKILSIIVIAAAILILGACHRGSSESVQGISGATKQTGASSEAAKDSSDTGQKSSNDNQNNSGNSVEIQFNYKRMPTEASNQIAVWVEDEEGRVVKTLYVSDFAGARRGYLKRKDAVPHWVVEADPDSMSDEAIDTVSSATLQDGEHSFLWDMTDQNGQTVPAGKYTVKIEGTLYWSSNVVYSGTIDTAKSAKDRSGNIAVKKMRSEPDRSDNQNMIDSVRIELEHNNEIQKH